MKPACRPLMPWRRIVIMTMFVAVVTVLIARAMDMQIIRSDFYEKQGDARQLRVVTVPSNRGQIVDRNDVPLAVSTPVHSVWLNPQEIDDGVDDALIDELAGILSLDADRIRKRIELNSAREFMYLRRHVSPDVAERVMKLGIPGLALQDEYRRFYPAGEAAAHVVGFSDIDDKGQEGIELAYDEWLSGVDGRKLVLRDRLGRAVDDVERISQMEPGNRVRLSIDKRIQYLAYKALKSAVLKHDADAGSAVVLDVDTGKVLAIVNQPSFNVNDRRQMKPGATRNRAVTDVFEPGSTMKPLTVAAALEFGHWSPDRVIDTSPGFMSIDGNIVKDARNYGRIDVGSVIARSSNVGISKIAMTLEPDDQFAMYQRFGLGADTGSGFPGEASGRLSIGVLNNDFERATMSFGYGVSVTPLQLARAYAAIAADGVLRPVSFLEDERFTSADEMRVIDEQTARQVREILRDVVSDTGTGKLAQVANYTAAGKTGTVKKFIAGGYAEDRYLSLFAGMVPAVRPKLVMVVVIDEPRGGDYYGGLVAGPVFSEVMSGAMRLLDVPPDDIAEERFADVRDHEVVVGG